MELGIIGAGASGLMAAFSAARFAKARGRQVNITVFDGNDRPGKKLLATGNGRCNLSNENLSAENYHGSPALFQSVYSCFDRESTLGLFDETGIPVYTDGAGRIYPKSRKAQTVVDILYFQCLNAGVGFRFETTISSIKKENGGYLLNGLFFADKLIIAAGGFASPAHGTDGNMIKLLKTMGIESEPVFPALSALTVKGFYKSLKGIRAQGRIKILCDKNVSAEDEGEIQYTDYGLSGIPSMAVSGKAARLLAGNKRKLIAQVDSLPDMGFSEIKERFMKARSRYPSESAALFLSGFMPKKLGEFLLKDAGVDPAAALGSLRPGEVNAVIGNIKAKEYEISGVKGFDFAQVTAGGIKTSEINTKTLELKKYKGVYLCGEILDVDGDCGGYNLQWAWSSGFVAGESSIREK